MNVGMDMMLSSLPAQLATDPAQFSRRETPRQGRLRGIGWIPNKPTVLTFADVT
jgi:hypothetical protein